MTQDEIIELVNQVGCVSYSPPPMRAVAGASMTFAQLEALIKLVEAKVEARYMQLFLDPENQPTQFGTATQEYRDQEILEEREACAKVCESTAWTSSIEEWRDMTKKDVASKSMLACAAAIRARGEKA